MRMFVSTGAETPESSRPEVNIVPTEDKDAMTGLTFSEMLEQFHLSQVPVLPPSPKANLQDRGQN